MTAVARLAKLATIGAWSLLGAFLRAFGSRTPNTVAFVKAPDRDELAVGTAHRV